MSVFPLRSQFVTERAAASDGVVTHNLGVNPVTAILVHLRPLNTATYRQWFDLLAAIVRITVLHQGSPIQSMSGKDAAALAWFRHGFSCLQPNNSGTDNDRRSVTVPIFFGRDPLDPSEGFPATRDGELTVEIDLDIANTGYDGLRYAIDGLEFVGASPARHERISTLSKTHSTTGSQRFDLPVGSLMRGALLFGTTGYSGGSPAPSWGKINVLADGVAVQYASVDFESLAPFNRLGRSGGLLYDSHLNASATAEPDEVGGGLLDYGLLDFDLSRDDKYSLKTSGLSRLQVEADVETADAVRVLPVEVVPN